MDVQATFTSALRSTLKEVLSTINVQTELWHYCILLPESNSSSLANLLGLSLTELVIILRLCGLINDRGDSYHLKIEPTITIRGSYSLKELLNQAQLNDNYFDKKKVKMSLIQSYGGWGLDILLQYIVHPHNLILMLSMMVNHNYLRV